MEAERPVGPEPHGPATFAHASVMLEEALSYLEVSRGGVFVDMTLGGGGHSEAILSRNPQTRVIGLDRDPTALLAASARLARFGERFRAIRAPFSRLEACLDEAGISGLSGVIFDLGVSSPQLDVAQRGFSFRLAGPLDMRMDPDGPQTAADLVNSASIDHLAHVFRTFGEERFAGPIARAIVQARARKPLQSTGELAALIDRTIPMKGRDRLHPATRVFQALRIEVNDELGELEKGLGAAYQRLETGGRLVVLSFHSLEDRIAKQFLRGAATACICPPRSPVCVCGREAGLEVLTRKPVEASLEEVSHNPRARSARLRAGAKL